MTFSFQRRAEQGLETLARLGLAFGVALLQQHGPGRGGQRLRQGREVARHQVQRKAAHDLETRQARRPVARAPASAGSRIAPESAQAASAVVVAAGSGASFSVAAVMMPSVPSLPIIRSRRS